MLTAAIHRLVEQHAALRGDTLAVLDGERALSYRELNQRANGVARQLIERGLRRGGRALVRMPAAADQAVVLLAVLKAGAAYTWIDPADKTGVPDGVSIRLASCGDQEQFVTLDAATLLASAQPSSPNLPILTRGTDIACVLQDGDGAPAVLVPHATVTALRSRPASRAAAWGCEPGALDLWMALIGGATAVVNEHAPVHFAAA